jgi:L-asparaginase II
MALAWARLGAAANGAPADNIPDGARAAASRLLAAMRAHPFLVAGTGRLDTELLEAGKGRVIAKVGAEGVYCAAILDLGLVFALKVENDTNRGFAPALLGLLDLLAPGVARGLDQHRSPAIKNTLGVTVGRIVPCIALQRDATKR